MCFSNSGENGRCTNMEEYYYLLCFKKHNCFHTHVETLEIHQQPRTLEPGSDCVCNGHGERQAREREFSQSTFLYILLLRCVNVLPIQNRKSSNPMQDARRMEGQMRKSGVGNVVWLSEKNQELKKTKFYFFNYFEVFLLCERELAYVYVCASWACVVLRELRRGRSL